MATSPGITSNGDSNPSSSLQKLLHQHLKILSEHLSLWSSIKNEKALGTRDHGAAQTCLDNTQAMIKNFQNLRMTLDNTSSTTADQQTNINGLNTGSKSGSQDQQRVNQGNVPPTVTDHTKPVKDVSDLFTIDTNPTPVESFQSSKAGKRAERNLKRKLSQSKLHPIGLPEPLQEIDEPRKRSRQDSAPGTIQAEVKPQPVTSNENDENDDSFVAKVQQKHQEKESKRQKKLDKKRKRESNTSLDEFAAAKASKPVKKKPKKDSSGVLERKAGNVVGQKRTTTDSNSQTVSNNGTFKKRKKTG